MKTSQGYPAVAIVRTFHFDELEIHEHHFETMAEAIAFTHKALKNEKVYVSPISVVEVQ